MSSLLKPFLRQIATVQGASTECDEWGKPITGEPRTIKVRWTRMPKEGNSLAGRVVTSMKSLANAEVLTDDPNISVGDVLVFESKEYTVSAFEEIRGVSGKLEGKKVWC